MVASVVSCGSNKKAVCIHKHFNHPHRFSMYCHPGEELKYFAMLRIQSAMTTGDKLGTHSHFPDFIIPLKHNTSDRRYDYILC